MKVQLVSSVLSALLLVGMSPAIDAQKTGGAGGTYRGPGDTVPTNRAKPSGGAKPVGPGNPGPGQPSGPGNTGPLSPLGPNPLAPSIPPPGAPGSPYDPASPDSLGGRPRVEAPESWQLWWFYNRWNHLEIGVGTSQLLASTGSDGFFLGRGQKTQDSPLLRATEVQIRDAIQPALIKEFEESNNSQVKTQILFALAKLRMTPDGTDPKDRDFGDFALESLRSGNQTEVERAILAVGVHGDPEFGAWLFEILRESDEAQELLGRQTIGVRLRSFAAYGLGLLGERAEDPQLSVQIQAELSEALFGGRPEIQAACLAAMGLIPLPVEDALTAGDELETDFAIDRVGQVLDVLSFFDDADNSFLARSQAPTTLARLLEGAPESLRQRVVQSLLIVLGTHAREQKEVQNGAVLALGAIGRSGPELIDRSVRKELERVAFKSNAQRLTRYFAMVALAQASARPGFEADPFSGLDATRKLLLRSISRARGQTLAWTALSLGLLEENAADRGELPPPETADALRQALAKNRSGEVAGAVSIALGLLKDQESQELLLERLSESGSQEVRAYTALALGMSRIRAATGPMRQQLYGSINQPFVLEQTAIGLSLLGDQQTGQRLFAMMEEASNPRTQAAIATAMGWIKDPRPLTPLSDRLAEREMNSNARGWAASAIGHIADKDTPPWIGLYSVGVNYDVTLPTLTEPEFETGILDLP